MYNGVDSCSIIGESSFGVLYSCLPQWMGETVWRCQIIALILVGRTATNTFNIDEDGTSVTLQKSYFDLFGAYINLPNLQRYLRWH